MIVVGRGYDSTSFLKSCVGFGFGFINWLVVALYAFWN